MIKLANNPLFGVQVMKKTTRSIATIALILSLAVGPALAQGQQRTLELQTDDGLIEIPLDSSVPMKLLSEGDISATAEAGFACPTDGASCDDVQVSLDTLIVSPDTVSHGSNVNIQWGSQGAWTCQGSGLPGTVWNSGNPKDPTDSQSVNTGDLDPGTSYQVEITCSNGPISASLTRTLTVTEDSVPVPAGCENVPPLSDYPEWTEASDVRYGTPVVNPATWVSVFGREFPKGGTFHFELTKGEYAAMKITTPAYLSSSSSGQINAEIKGTSSYSGAGPRMVSITPCPGVFDPQEISDPKCLKAAGSTDSFYWVGPGHPYSSFQCELQPNTTYYVNMLFSGSSAGTMPPVQSDCRYSSDAACSLLLIARDTGM